MWQKFFEIVFRIKNFSNSLDVYTSFSNFAPFKFASYAEAIHKYAVYIR